mmetsp:Transcript_34091/g.67884  ORF Transcript_34091/g.67884 Transcript_34091/m.67884 type:complete len:306 (-) Transcript_34091:650-1567(-)
MASEDGLTFSLHIPAVPAEMVEAEDIDVAFSHTPRGHPSWFEAEPAAELIEQCLRPGHCSMPEGEARDWLHRRLVHLGHAANDRDETLMAHTWFECAYATKASVVELISSANMRLKLGQWTLVEQLYKQIVQMELSEAQREVAERKLAEVTARSARGDDRPIVKPEEEFSSLLAAPSIVTETISGPEDRERMTSLLRSCGFAANKKGDFEAAQLWFECCFAFSSSLSDMLSAANMRVKLDQRSPVAALAYKHVLSVENASQMERQMATRKLAGVEEAGDVEYRKQERISAAEANGVSYGGNISAR